MAIRLFDWGPSPFCLKVRAILDRKGVPYERRNVLGWGLVELWRRGRIGKVPALDIDGELICDSTDIAYALDQRFPHPAIIPGSPRERALCHAIEEWADESLYFVGLHLQWNDPQGRKMAAGAFGKTPFGAVAFHAYARRIRRQIEGQGTGRKPIEHVRRDLLRHLDAAEELLAGREFAIDGQPRLCDFALMSQLVYLRRTPIGGAAMAERAGIARYLDRMKTLRATPATS